MKTSISFSGLVIFPSVPLKALRLVTDFNQGSQSVIFLLITPSLVINDHIFTIITVAVLIKDKEEVKLLDKSFLVGFFIAFELHILR